MHLYPYCLHYFEMLLPQVWRENWRERKQIKEGNFTYRQGGTKKGSKSDFLYVVTLNEVNIWGETSSINEEYFLVKVVHKHTQLTLEPMQVTQSSLGKIHNFLSVTFLLSSSHDIYKVEKYCLLFFRERSLKYPPNSWLQYTQTCHFLTGSGEQTQNSE